MSAYVASLRREKAEDAAEYDDDDDNDNGDDGRIDRVVPSRATKRGTEGGREGGALPSFWRVLVRGGGRLGWLEGVPFQTLRIDLFVDGTPSFHPVLVVVDHVLKLFQRSFYRGNRSGRRDGLRRAFR